VQGHLIPQGGSFCMEGGHPLAQDPFGPPMYAPPPPPPPPPAPTSGQPPQADGPGGDPQARRSLAGFLVSYQDDELGKFWPLWQGKNSIGRADTGQRVQIEVAHGTTSTHHATIECDPQRFVLSDLGSTNGTFHNEEAIGFQGKRELRDGDKVRFGGYSVMVVNVVSRT
jgi:FHA domain